ncbi:MAG TPA: hypothetical protein P5145_01860 [Tenuifilaceae bacterium]|nr:hypothetical protein [Tenuifilaceae bacterium]
MNKTLAILLLGLITTLKPLTAQEISELIIDPTIRDFVEINPQVQLHYASTGFSIDKIAVFDDYSLIFTQTGAKLYLIDNKNHLIQDEWDFKKDGKLKVNDIRYSPGKDDKGKNVFAWKFKTPFHLLHGVQISSLPDSGKIVFGKVEKSMSSNFFFCATIKNGEINYELIPIETKNIIPENFNKKYGKHDGVWSTESYLKIKDDKLFTLWSYPTTSTDGNGKILKEAKIKNILIKQDKNGIPTEVEYEEVKTDEKYFYGCYIFRYKNSNLLFKVREQSITIYDDNLNVRRTVILNPEFKKHFGGNAYKHVNCTIFKDEKLNELWLTVASFSDSLKKSFTHYAKINIEGDSIIQTHFTVKADKDLSVIPQFIHNGTLYFRANPSDIDYSAIFKVTLKQNNGDTIFLRRSNSIAINLFDKRVHNFGFSQKQTYTKLPSKTAENLGLKTKSKINIDSLSILVSKALECLENKNDLKFASELCLYDSYNLGRISFLEKSNQLKDVPVFTTDSQRELLIMLMKRLQKDTKDVDMEQKSSFIEATTPDGWKFVLVKTPDGYRFGSTFFKKIML